MAETVRKIDYYYFSVGEAFAKAADVRKAAKVLGAA